MKFNPLKKIILTLSQYHGYINITIGVCLILTGLSKFIDNQIISAILTFASSVVLIFVLALCLGSSENEDERSIQNRDAAGRQAFLILIILLLVANTLFRHTDFEKYAASITHIIAGIGLASFGWNFLKYERGQ